MARNVTNYASCCRLCLTDESPSFDDARHDRSLQRNISSSLGVEIASDDKLPTAVCQQCVNKVSSWHLFKLSCSENQTKLLQWLHSNAPNVIANMTFQIKEEPVDDTSNSSPVIMINGEPTMIKTEISDVSMDEEYNDLPPPLTPQHIGGEAMLQHPEPEQQTPRKKKSPAVNPKRCTYCKKILSSIANRKRHERNMHDAPESDNTSSQDDASQNSIDSQPERSPSPETTAEEKKILFAAGLKLLQRNSTPITQETLSKIEVSYIEKCKAMVKMHESLICACHNAPHTNLKRLLSHLRSLRIWFPVYTCYHCMITFTDRSTSQRHFARCPNTNLSTLIKLSNLKKRSEVKTRLYQIYKCKKCQFMYTFHEDFCRHVDEDHTNVTMPLICKCGRKFTTIEDYKDHAYVSCLVEYYCDLCFVTVNSLSAFQAHAAEKHDHSEGFVLLQEDNYRKRPGTSMEIVKTVETRPRPSLKREYTDERNIITGKRRSSYKPPVIDPEFDDEEEEEKTQKVVNPAHPKLPGTTCPICHREYASNNNMWRHYKTHVQDPPAEQQKDNSVYCCPDCGGMFNTNEWEKHKTMHIKKTCSECGKIFQFQSELDQHRSVHLNLKVYRDSKTQSYKSAMVSPDPNIVVLCEICDRTFQSKEELKAHKLTHDEMPVLEKSVPAVVSAPKDPRFYCKMCDKQYMGYSGISDHNRKKHPEMHASKSKFPKQCAYCDKIFTTAGAYANHKMMHERNSDLISQSSSNRSTPNTADSNDDESYHTCKKCFKVFSTRSNLKNHMKSHGINLASPSSKTTKKPVKKVWCQTCHCAFDNASLLQKHRAEEHDKQMPDLIAGHSEEKSPFVFTCDVCVQTFTSKSGLKKHKAKHAKEAPIIMKNRNMVHCKYCKITFETSQQLAFHMKEEHVEPSNGKSVKETSKEFFCKRCKKHFKSLNALCAHMGWHKREGRVKDKLDRSSNGIPAKASNQNKPKVKEEPKEYAPTFQCNKCNASFANDTSLQIHILEKHRNVNAIVLAARCTSCNLDFATQEEYEQHKQFHGKKGQQQQQAKNFLCTHCNTVCRNFDALQLHIREMHSKAEQPKQEFKCGQCSRVFDRENSLNIHLKVHAKQVKTAPSQAKTTMYNCSICNQSFALPKDLRTHTIQAHPF